jgi:hypothetical protein
MCPKPLDLASNLLEAFLLNEWVLINQVKPAAAMAKWGGTDCEETTNDVQYRIKIS